MQIRIPYADTDQMGMVYYANYFIYFERGRTEWLREFGYTYKELEKEGTFLPVIESSCKYISPAKYDDVIIVKTEIEKIGYASIEFKYEVFLGGKIIAQGSTKHPFVDRNFRPTRIPKEFRAILEKAHA